MFCRCSYCIKQQRALAHVITQQPGKEGGSGFRGTPIKLLWDPDVGGVSL